jgi:hypothetical protein
MPACDPTEALSSGPLAEFYPRSSAAGIDAFLPPLNNATAPPPASGLEEGEIAPSTPRE